MVAIKLFTIKNLMLLFTVFAFGSVNAQTAKTFKVEDEGKNVRVMNESKLLICDTICKNGTKGKCCMFIMGSDGKHRFIMNSENLEFGALNDESPYMIYIDEMLGDDLLKGNIDTTIIKKLDGGEMIKIILQRTEGEDEKGVLRSMEKKMIYIIKTDGSEFKKEMEVIMLRDLDEHLTDFNFDEENVVVHKVQIEEGENGTKKVRTIIIEIDDEGNEHIHETVKYHKIVEIVNIEEGDKMIWKGQDADLQRNDLDIEELNIYPNPNSGQFSLEFTLSESGTTTISLYDLEGNEVMKEKLKDFSGSYSKQFDLSDQPKGVYVLQIKQNDNQYYKKIILQ